MYQLTGQKLGVYQLTGQKLGVYQLTGQKLGVYQLTGQKLVVYQQTSYKLGVYQQNWPAFDYPVTKYVAEGYIGGRFVVRKYFEMRQKLTAQERDYPVAGYPVQSYIMLYSKNLPHINRIIQYYRSDNVGVWQHSSFRFFPLNYETIAAYIRDAKWFIYIRMPLCPSISII